MTAAALLFALTAVNPILSAPVVSPVTAPFTPGPPRRYDTVLLKNDELIEGEILEMENNMLSVRVEAVQGMRVLRLPLSQVVSFAIDQAARDPQAAEEAPRGVGWLRHKRTPRPTATPAPRDNAPAMPSPMPLEGVFAIDGSVEDEADEFAALREERELAALAEQLNDASKPLTTEEKRLLELYNRHLTTHRHALTARVEAYNLRTHAAEYGKDLQTRRQMLQDADKLEQEADRLDGEAERLYAEYRQAARRQRR